ncbi:MAG: class I SAM-dependent methyltransferase [Planctomycetes bacterium]|nr:class I SAM-dependent methyltransferase [Planctomycetota bacterium]
MDQRAIDALERREVRELLRPSRGQLELILDAPAGYGRLTTLLAELSPRAVFAVDLSLERVRCVPRLPGIVVVQADLAHLPFRPKAFDLVACFRHFHHIRDPEDQRLRLAQIANVARRRVLLTYYEPLSLHALQRGFLVRLRRRKRRLGFMAPTFVHAELERLGFRVVADRALIPWIHAQRILLAERVGSSPT